MMNRILGTILAVTWIIAMALLIRRDVAPFWTAQEAPDQLLPAGEYQVGIYSQKGQRLGTTWVTATATQLLLVRSTTVLEAGKIAGFLPVSGTWVLTTDLAYDGSGKLDHFRCVLNAPGLTGEVDAERIERDFSVIAKIGEMKQSLLLDGELSRCLSEALRPFTHLKGLRVGQSWRMRLLDPFALIRSQSAEFQTILVNVKGKEPVEHLGKTVDCYRVESPSAVAWADETGRVLKQEVQLPLIGKWTLIDEPVDATVKRRAAAPERRKSEKP